MDERGELVRVLASMRTRWLTDRIVLAAIARDAIENVSGSCDIYHCLSSASGDVSSAVDNVNNAIAEYNKLVDLETLQQRGT